MKSFILAVGFALFLYIHASAQNNDIETIKKLNYNWLNALPQRDTATLDKILADDFILVNPAGKKQTKKDVLLNTMDSTSEIISVDFDDVEVRMLQDDVAILSAWTHFSFKANGKQMNGKNCYQDVYMERNGKWVAVSAHVTLLNGH